MKRTGICLLLALTLLLTGCGGGEKQLAAEFTQKLQSAENVEFTAQLKTEYEDKTAQFKLKFSYEDSCCTVEVLEPELIAGIRAHIKDGESSLEYDGAVLDIGALDARGLCPMSALPLVFEAMRSAYTELAWFEDEVLCLRLVPDDEYTVTLRVDKATLTPEYAEIVYRERTVVYAEISDWEIGE